MIVIMDDLREGYIFILFRNMMVFFREIGRIRGGGVFLGNCFFCIKFLYIFGFINFG